MNEEIAVAFNSCIVLHDIRILFESAIDALTSTEGSNFEASSQLHNFPIQFGTVMLI